MYEETCSSPDNLRLNKNPFYIMQVEKNDSLFAIKDICQYVSFQFWCDRKPHEKNAL